MIDFDNIVGFQWDDGNDEKNWQKHRVSRKECEEAFLDSNARMLNDAIHSERELRYILLGRVGSGRLLCIVFTVREQYIRVISARDINRKKETCLYEETN